MNFLNDFFNTARKNGISSLEEDLDAPDKSALFKRHPNFNKDQEAMLFFCDTMRTQVAGGVEVHDLDSIMELDLEILHNRLGCPSPRCPRWRIVFLDWELSRRYWVW